LSLSLPLQFFKPCLIYRRLIYHNINQGWMILVTNLQINCGYSAVSSTTGASIGSSCAEAARFLSWGTHRRSLWLRDRSSCTLRLPSNPQPSTITAWNRGRYPNKANRWESFLAGEKPVVSRVQL